MGSKNYLVISLGEEFQTFSSFKEKSDPDYFKMKINLSFTDKSINI